MSGDILQDSGGAVLLGVALLVHHCVCVCVRERYGRGHGSTVSPAQAPAASPVGLVGTTMTASFANIHLTFLASVSLRL